MSNLGVLTGGNLVLRSANGSVNFLSSVSTTPQVGVLAILFDKNFSLDDGKDEFSTSAVGGATVGREPGRDYISLRAPDSGACAVLQSKQYVISIAGASRIVTAVANLDPLGTLTDHPGMVARVGSFDSAAQKTDSARGDGFFFQLDSDGFSVVRRSSTGGSPGTDELVPQADWILDRADGSGMSEYTLNATQTNVFIVCYEQICGVGSVKMGILAGSSIVFVHRFDALDWDQRLVRTSSLPVRFELSNDTGETGLDTELRAVSCGVSSSGGVPRGMRRSCGTKAIARDISSFVESIPLMSVRLRPAFVRATAQIKGISLTCTTAVFWELVLNGAVANAEWTPTAENALTEFDKSADSITGGTVVQSGYAAVNTPVDIALDARILPLTSDLAGVPDVYTLNVVCLMSSGIAWTTMMIEENS